MLDITKYKSKWLISRNGTALALVSVDKTIQFMFYTTDADRERIERIVYGESNYVGL